MLVFTQYTLSSLPSRWSSSENRFHTRDPGDRSLSYGWISAGRHSNLPWSGHEIVAITPDSQPVMDTQQLRE
jgi:hypothetical protein